jgi:hypothetical protein
MSPKRAPGPPPAVLVDGVRYVPVSAAHITLPAIIDAIVTQWHNDGWRTQYPRAADHLRVIVSGSGEDDADGETVTAFAARLLEAAERREGS